MTKRKKERKKYPNPKPPVPPPPIPAATYPFQNLSLEDMPEEQWMDIPGYDGLYLVSTMGRVKSLPREVKSGKGWRITKERIMKQQPQYSYNDYVKDFIFSLFVPLRLNRKARGFSVARIAYNTFITPLDENRGKLVLHLDFDGLNNRLENLFAVTQREMALRILALKRKKMQFLMPANRECPVSRFDLSGNYLTSYPSVSIAAQSIKQSIAGISMLINESVRRKTAGGFLWKKGYEQQSIEPVLPDNKLKPVSQYDLSGQWMASYPSMSEAAKNLNILFSSISNAIRGKSKSAGGFLWRCGEDQQTLPPVVRQSTGLPEPVSQYDLSGQWMATYPSIIEAARRLDIVAGGISHVLNERSKTAGGFMWRYGHNKQAIKPYITGNPVNQYDLSGKWMATHPSVSQAAHSVNLQISSISAVLHDQRKSAGGFLWRYGEDQQAIAPAIPRKRRNKPVSQYDLSGKWITTYTSVKKAAHNLNLLPSSISQAIHGTTKTAGGFLWKEGDSRQAIEPATPKLIAYKPVSQYNLSGKWIATYDAVVNAARETHISAGQIYKAVHNSKISAGGFLWRSGEDRQDIEPHLTGRPVSQYDLSGKWIATYPSVSEAGRRLNLAPTSISATLHGRQKTTGGFLWREGESKVIEPGN